jgi:hypothetical protein
MNNTKKTTLAIAAIFIAATLVVGGSIAITTGQSAYAFQKKGDKGNGNGNTVTIQKCKQSATQSGWDNDQEQECENVICTHPGNNATCAEEGVTTISTTTPQPTTGTLLVTKICTNCPGPVPFTIQITGNNNAKPSTFVLTVISSSSQLVTLGPGTFTIVESSPGLDDATFSGDCAGVGFGSATVTISAGQRLTCTITNHVT